MSSSAASMNASGASAALSAPLPPPPPPPPSPPASFFDALLLTASNPQQATAFGAEIRARQSRGSLPPADVTRVVVVCDPGGQRIGSGGATLAALEALLVSLPGESRSQQLEALKKMKIGMFH